MRRNMDWDKYSIVMIFPISRSRYISTSSTTIIGIKSVMTATMSTTKYGIPQANPMRRLIK